MFGFATQPTADAFGVSDGKETDIQKDKIPEITSTSRPGTQPVPVLIASDLSLSEIPEG